MTLDDLRREWSERDRQLESTVRLNIQLLRENYLAKNHEYSRKLGGLGWFELISAISCIVLFALFNANHWLDWKFFVPGALLQAWVTFMLAVSIYQREALRNIDYSQPVVMLQREIEVLKMHRIVTLKWALLTGQLVWWMPFVIVFFKGILGVNLYAQSGWMDDFIIANIAVGIGLIPLAILASKALGRRWGKAPWFQKLTDNLAGNDLMAAKNFLEKLKRFEGET